MDHASYLHHSRYQNQLPSGENEQLALLQNDETRLSRSSPRKTVPTSRLKVPVLVALSLWLVIMTVEFSPFLVIIRTGKQEASSINNSMEDDDDDALDALWGSSAYDGVFGIRMCDLDECISSPCRHSKTAPFSCLSLRHSDHVQGGCAETPWTNEICAEQCDATRCHHLVKKAKAVAKRNRKKHKAVAPAVRDCDVECPSHWCRKRRLCGNDFAPYQCMVGESVYGCSADKYQWTVRSSEADCSACCKTTSCP